MARSSFERLITDFNHGREEWRLSLSAQNVLREIFMSFSSDEIGVVGLEKPEQRRLAQQKAIESLPDFLGELVKQAENVPADKRSGDEKVIGAIFVSQHIKRWADKCGCLPRD